MEIIKVNDNIYRAAIPYKDIFTTLNAHLVSSVRSAMAEGRI